MKSKIKIQNKPRTKLRLSTNLVLGTVIAASMIAISAIVFMIVHLGSNESTKAAVIGETTFLSISNGDWEDVLIWSSTSGSIPNDRDNITVRDTVIFNGNLGLQNYLSINEDADLTLDDLSIKNGATLNVDGILRVNNLEFDNGSFIVIAEGASVTVSGNFTNKNNSDNVTVDGNIFVEGDFYNGNGGVITGIGSITAIGEFTGDGTTFGISPNATVPDGSTVPNTLPISLIEFKAIQNGKNIELAWSTATELNNDYFTIERSFNGTDFTPIEYIKGSGTTNYKIDYSYTDYEPQEGINYYRLTQTDFDGQFEQFDIKVVELIFDENNEIMIDKVYPNPFTNYCKIEFITSSNLPVELFFVNMSGIVVRKQLIDPIVGYNEVEINNLSSLPIGNYIAYLTQGSVKTEVKKIIKK